MPNHQFPDQIETHQAGAEMYALIERLYPICRSITGDGVRETLQIISEHLPVEIHEVPSGTKVLDWEVPPEWNIRDAWIKNEKGEVIIDFKQLNLHVLNYSIPVRKKVSLEELKEHLFTLPEHPEWVPYRTSYYNRNWGFCMAHNQYQKLEEGTYEVLVDSTLAPGSLTYGEYFHPGRITDEVLISCHICHPSLCNDNLSGIAVASRLANLLSHTSTKYSYRFLFIPGTIGSITWLSKNREKVKSIKYGLVLTLLGDDSPFHYKRSRGGNAEIDHIVEKQLNEQNKEHKIIEFYPYGYDERQFCSPGFNLAVGRLSRKPHGEFPEYHTSADNLAFVKSDRLAESFQLLIQVIQGLEQGTRYLNLSPYGEPQLGKRGLFKKIGGAVEGKAYEMALLWMLNMSDGNHSIEYISDLSGVDLETLKGAARSLSDAGLLKNLDAKND
ncbi:MAG: DUF4910 domain-containing protein [bacterium]